MFDFAHHKYAQCKQKGFAPVQILVGVLILIVVVSGAYYFGKSQTSKPQLSSPPIISQTPQPTTAPQVAPKDKTTNWKTYTNSKYSYSIKYPGDWNALGFRKYDPPDSGNARIAYIGETVSQLGEPGEAFMDMVVEPNSENKIPTKEWYLERVKNIPAGVYTSSYKIEEIIFNGMKALKVVMSNTNEEIFFIKDNNLFRINYFYLKDNKQPPDEIFKLMPSAFKFLPDSAEGKFCGGIAGNLPENQCPTGYRCQLDGNYPDAGGKCVKL